MRPAVCGGPFPYGGTLRVVPAPTLPPRRINKSVELLVFQIAAVRLPEPVREHLFAPPGGDGRPVRRWRFDLAFPDRKLAVEIDGALLTGGRHGGAPSAVRDVEKRLAAAVLGWRVLHFYPSQVKSGEALTWLEAAFGRRPPPITRADRGWPAAPRRRTKT